MQIDDPRPSPFPLGLTRDRGPQLSKAAASGHDVASVRIGQEVPLNGGQAVLVEELRQPFPKSAGLDMNVFVILSNLPEQGDPEPWNPLRFQGERTASTTAAACPSTFTLGKILRTTPSASMTRVVLSTPMDVRPYMVFSFQTP